MNGGFSPLTGFMTQEVYNSVLNSLRLKNGLLWPIPITLDINEEEIKSLSINLGTRLVLKDPRDHTSLAILTINSVWKPDKTEEALRVFKTTDLQHPSVNYLFNSTKSTYIGGEIQALNPPVYYDYSSLRYTPSQLRQKFQNLSWKKIVGFQTRNPMHKAHVNLTLKASSKVNGNLLIHPVVGITKPGDIDYHTRVKVYKAVIEMYPEGMATLALLPLAMRMAGPREAVWHAIIRRNYGATHFIVGRDHAGPGKSSSGADFYSPYEAQSLVQTHQKELGIEIIPFASMIYLPKTNEYKPMNEIENGVETKDISGTELRRLLRDGEPIPNWFSFQSVVEILREAYPPRNKQGFVLFLTGPGRSSKRNLSKALQTTLHEKSNRSITLLLDSSTKHLDPEGIKSHAFISAELCRSGAAVISCSDYTSTEENRQVCLEGVKRKGGRGGNGIGFLVYVSGSFGTDAVGESNANSQINGNVKINGILKTNGNAKINGHSKINGFQKIDHEENYEVPLNPDLTINLSLQSISESVQQITSLLESNRFL